MNAFTVATRAALGLALACVAGWSLALADDMAGTATEKIPARYKFYTDGKLPAAYKGKTNPKSTTVAIVIRGADFYNENCSSCHGLMGFGNGAAGNALRPKPADLAWSMGNPALKDDFFLWTIAEGGAQFGSNMPAFKDKLRQDQIWEMITYMRAAFEGREARAPAPRPVRQAMAVNMTE